METTKFVSKTSLFNDISSTFQTIEEILSKEKTNVLYLHKNEVHNTEKLLNSIFTLNDKNLNTQAGKIILPILKSVCLKAESKSGNSSIILIEFLCKAIKNILKDNHKNIENELNLLLEEIEKNLPNFIKYPKWSDIEDIITSSLNDEKLISMLFEAFNLSGIEGRIFIEGSKSNKNSVELFNGYNFKLETYDFLLGADRRWKENFVKCCVIDGIVANVHEIDQLLTASAEKKIPLIIFAKGFENEILTTVKLNNDKGIFNVFLVKVNLEVELLNIINDIAIVCGTDIVSTLKGNTLAFIKYDELPIVDYISCFKNNIIIKNSGVEDRVKLSIRELIKARDKHNDESVIKMFNNRIKALTSNFVIIKVASSSNQERLKKIEKLDETLRMIKSTLIGGIFNSKDGEELCNNISQNISPFLKQSFSEALKNGNDIYPAMNIASSAKYACSFIKTIMSSEGAIVLDK